MKIVIDIPKGGASRAAVFLGLPIAVVVATAMVASAYDGKWISAGQPLNASLLKADLDEFHLRLSALEVLGLQSELSGLHAQVDALEIALPKTWPEGSYCVFRSKNTCPPGFKMEQMSMPDVQADSVPSVGTQAIGLDSSITYCVTGGCSPDGVDQHYKVRHVIVACCK